VKRLSGVRPYRINDDEPIAGEEEPIPPVGRDGDWLETWEQVCEDLRIMHIGPYRSDRAALICLTDAIRVYERLADIVVKAPAVVRGPDGTPVAPSIVKELRASSAEVSRWCGHFGLSPSTRTTVRTRLAGMGGTPPPYSDLLSPGHRDPRRLLSPGAR
jgi:Phage terminase, small subunit